MKRTDTQRNNWIGPAMLIIPSIIISAISLWAIWHMLSRLVQDIVKVLG